MAKLQSSLNLLALLTIIGLPALGVEAAQAQAAITETEPVERSDAAVNPTETAVATDIAAVSDAQPATTIEEWQAQIEAARVQITGIRVEATEAGLQVSIETDGELAALTQSTSGNARVLEIPNATLAEAVQEFEPADGIALVQANALPGDIVQVVITGSDAVPVVNISTSATGLVLGVTPGVTQAGTEDDAIQLVVTGEEDGYAAPNTTTATRTDTPLIEVPQSVQVITQAVLEDQGVIRLNDALRNAPGVVPGNTVGGSNDAFTIRGFDDATLLQDGFTLPGGVISSIRETSNLERVEVLRGPAAILYGNVEPGGVINVVTKQPEATFASEVTAQMGSYDLFRPTFDITGPANESGTVRYRLNAAYEQSEGFRDFDTDVSRVFVAPTVAIDLGDRTELTLELEYFDDERPFDRGIPAFNGAPADISRETILGEPFDFVKAEDLSVGYRIEHHFSDNWQVRNRFRYGSADAITLRANVLNPFIDADGNVPRAFFSNENTSRSYEVQTEVQGEFSTGSINHTLLAAVDYYSINTTNLTTASFTTPVNIFNPQTGLVPRPDLPLDLILSDGTGNQKRVGLLLQDQIELLPQLNVLLGGRVDFLNPSGQTTGQSDTAFTPRLGIVYQPIEALAFYGSYSQSFQPNSPALTTSSGESLDPQEGEQFEVGVKANLLDGRLAATLSFYDISLTNVPTLDPNNIAFVLPIGRQSSRGFEFDITGEILPGWNILAGVGFVDAAIEESNDPQLPVGNALSGVADTTANFWTTYEIQSGDLAGLGFGLGLYYVGERFGNPQNSFRIEEYLRTDAAIYYRQDDFRLGFNFRNLFDVNYFENVSGIEDAAPGEPFTVIGNISFSF